MEKWDKLYNPLAGKKERCASSRANICPEEKQGPGGFAPGSEEEQQSEWEKFFAENKKAGKEVEKGLRPMPPLNAGGTF